MSTKVRRLWIAVAAIAGAGVCLVLLMPILQESVGSHSGEQVAEPDPSTAGEDLGAATAELHGHLNWLIWGDGGPAAQPAEEFVVLADLAVELARSQRQTEVAELVRSGRDALLRNNERRRAHDLLAEAEALVTGGDLDGAHRYDREVDATLE